MKCYSPISIKVEKLNRRIMVRCGKCLACREEIAKEYTLRYIQESKKFKYLYFLTLTYRDENVPYNERGYLTLKKDDLTKYLKVINVNVKRKLPLEEYKYFACGEYGDQTERPHYHIVLSCNNQEIGKLFLKKWFAGDVKFEEASIQSVFYTIGYVNKKIKDKDYYYDLNEIERPFRKFSRGLGKDYYEENKKELAEKYYANIGKNKIALPKYYKDKLKDSGLVDIEELTKKAEESNRELRNWYAKKYNLSDKRERYKDGSFDFMPNEIDEKIENMLKQRKANYIAKYNLKKSRDLT